MEIMSLSPQILLSKAIRNKFIANLKNVPNFGTTLQSNGLQYASVLIPMCIRNEELHILYTLRSSNLKNHSGQVSFPGGKSDGEESIVDTALRETEEEIGVPREAVDVWSVMPPFQGLRKDLIITPVVGVVKDFDFNKLTPNKDEVEEVFTVPIESMCNTNTHGHFIYKELPMPLYLYDKYIIWGITGFITHMFLLNFVPDDLYNFNFNGARYDYEDLRQSKL